MEFPENPVIALPSNVISDAEDHPELQYWRSQLIPNPPVIELPCDGVRSAKPNGSQGECSIPLQSKLRYRLKQWCEQQELSLETVLLATFKVLIHRYTDETTILIYGTRSAPAPQSLNPLLLRTEILPSQTGHEIYHAVQQTVLEANTHDRLSLETLMAQLQPDRDLKTEPLTWIEFGIQTEIQKLQQSHDRNLDLVFTIVLSEQGVLGEQDWKVHLSYRSSLFLPDTIARLVGHYECLLTSFLDRPDHPIQSWSLLTSVEEEQILKHWNRGGRREVTGDPVVDTYLTSDHITDDRCIHEYIEAQVEKTPNAIALVSTDHEGHVYQLTYRELNTKANQLAHYLTDYFQSQPQSSTTQSEPHAQTPVVAVCVDRSPEMVIAFLGILKAGAAYLPLDPLYPQERRVYKLQDCQTPLLLTQESLASIIVPDDFKGSVLCLDRDWQQIEKQPTTNPLNSSTLDTLAYIIYTSGSTGNPKGVMIPHRGLVNHCFAMRDAFELQPHDRMLQFSSMSFDIIIEELYPTLVTGATLVLRSDIIASSITQFLNFVETHQVSLLDLPTAFWHELVRGLAQLNCNLPDAVRLVVVGGEKASKALYQQWCGLVSPRVRWLNTYGPTETTVSATLYEPAAEGFQWDEAEIPIGRPINNVQAYILDRNHNPVPIGIPGELYIGGAGVAHGYLNQTEKTKEKFIPNPFSQDQHDLIYSTGDVVRYRPDGTIEFVGRRDFQIKIRGFRIELGEIERVLESHPEIQQAVVIALESASGQKSLAAYYVLKSSVHTGTLRNFLLTKLPNYMVPSYFTEMAILPLTPNGKVDRKALPNPQSSTAQADLEAPKDEIETQLLEIWKDLFGVSHLCMTDNFFEIGGHSLLITRMLIAIEAQWHKSMPINILFEAPTIRQLAEFLRSENPHHARQTVIPFRSEGQKPPIFCVPGARGNLLFAHSLVQHWDDRDHPIYGLQEPLNTDISPLPSTIEEIAHYYIQQIKTVQTEGPYYLVGYSIGGLIAYEMAQQLRSQGQDVALLGLLDPAPPTAANRSRQIIKKFVSPNSITLTIQLTLLKLLAIQDFYQIRTQEMAAKTVPSYLVKEFQTWLSSGEAQTIWRRFQGILGFKPTVKAIPLDSNIPPLSLEMVMKYDRAILHYLPQPYSGVVKFFSSEEWSEDIVNWHAWERLYACGADRSLLSGSHTMFYRMHTAEIVDRLLPKT